MPEPELRQRGQGGSDEDEERQGLPPQRRPFFLRVPDGPSQMHQGAPRAAEKNGQRREERLAGECVISGGLVSFDRQNQSAHGQRRPPDVPLLPMENPG